MNLPLVQMAKAGYWFEFTVYPWGQFRGAVAREGRLPVHFGGDALAELPEAVARARETLVQKEEA